MKTFIYIAASLDGFIARKDGNLDWLDEIPNPGKDDFGFNEFMQKIDAVVMGKNTYEKVMTFKKWPYLKPVFILSSTIKSIPDELKKKVEIMKGNPKHILDSLSDAGFNNFYIDGGATIRNFLKEDLIDELIITRIPVLLGDGIPLFQTLPHELKFEHVKTDVYNNGLVKSHYIKKRD